MSVVSDKLIICESEKSIYGWEETGLNESSKKMINVFKDQYTFENYNPHITITNYDIDEFGKDIKFPIEFTTNEIALFHIGNSCTCRKLIYSEKLNP